MSMTLLTVGAALLLAGSAFAWVSEMPMAGVVSAISGASFILGVVLGDAYGWASKTVAAGVFTFTGISMVVLGCTLGFGDRFRLLDGLGTERRENAAESGRFLGAWSTALGGFVALVGVATYQTVTPPPIWWGFAIACVVFSWWAMLGIRRSVS